MESKDKSNSRIRTKDQRLKIKDESKKQPSEIKEKEDFTGQENKKVKSKKIKD